MIYTSYFANLKKLPKDYIQISICTKSPSWYTGFQYKKLAPSYDILMQYKSNPNTELYTKRFKEEILNKLNISDVMNDLYDYLDEYTKFKCDMINTPWWNLVNIVLLCYEKPTYFCHRHLIAEWITKEFNGLMNVKELEL